MYLRRHQCRIRYVFISFLLSRLVAYLLNARDEWITKLNRACASDRGGRSVATSTSVRC